MMNIKKFIVKKYFFNTHRLENRTRNVSVVSQKKQIFPLYCLLSAFVF
jgi:hypothetical protein